jgi:hypothetical protein
MLPRWHAERTLCVPVEKGQSNLNHTTFIILGILKVAQKNEGRYPASSGTPERSDGELIEASFVSGTPERSRCVPTETVGTR